MHKAYILEKKCMKWEKKFWDAQTKELSIWKIPAMEQIFNFINVMEYIIFQNEWPV